MGVSGTNIGHSGNSDYIIFFSGTMSKQNNCSLCCFLNHIFFAFVNQELCRVLCDEANSHLWHFLVFIVAIVMKVSHDETVLLLKKLIIKKIMKK